MDLVTQILQFLFSGITNGAIYGLIALGFTIIYNATEVINFAQGELVMLGGMVMIALSNGTSLPLPVGFILSVLVVSGIGALFERFTIRPLKNPTQIGIIIITIGVSILLKGVAMFIWGKETLSSRPFSSSPPIHIGSSTLDPQSLWILGITFGILLLLHFFYQKTITGKAMRACAFNKRAAGLAGIPTQKMVLLSFVLSSALGAAAGVAITPITMCSYDMGTILGLKGFCAVVLGGLGSTVGSVVGGFILGIVEALGAGLISSSLRDAIAFVLLLGMLFVRPQGIFGIKEVKKI